MLLKPFESAWLDFAYEMMTTPPAPCACERVDGGIRWPGFIGPSYRGVLLVGARHNAKGLKKAGMTTGPLGAYVKALRAWKDAPRLNDLTERDRAESVLISTMQTAMRHCMPLWSKHGMPLANLSMIRESLDLRSWNDIAFVNLARCYMAPTGTKEDDAHAAAHEKHYALDRIVKQLQPSLVFIAKILNPEPPVSQNDFGVPLVVRFSNHGLGERNGEYAREWVPREAPEWKRLLSQRTADTGSADQPMA